MASSQNASAMWTMRVTLTSLALATAFCRPLLAQTAEAPPQPKAAALEATASDSILLGSYLRAVALGDTGLIVADSRAGRLVVFDRHVGLVRSFARSGDGPGEFRVAASLGRLNDQTWLFDPTQGRLTKYSASGDFVYSKHLTPPPHSPGPYLGGVVIGAESDSVFAWEFDVARLALAGAAPIRHTILIAAPDGSVLDTLASFDRERETWPLSGSLGLTGILPNPFSYSPLWSMLPNGTGVVVVVPDQAPSRTSAALTIEWRFRDRPVSRIVVPYRPIRLQYAWADSMVTRVASPLLATGSFSLLDVRRASDSRLRLPMYMPPVTALLTSDDGNAWIRREDPAGTQVAWSVWSPDGKMVATFVVPSSVRGIAVSGNVLWAVQEDESGEERVVKYRY